MKKKMSIASNSTLVRETRALMFVADNTNAECNNPYYLHISHGLDKF